jgi:hypothetical protein
MSHTAEPVLTLDQVDVDGALQESAEKAFGRSDFLRKVALGGTGLVGGGMLMGAFAKEAQAQVPQSDVDILNYALTLERLEAAFYTRAVLRAGLTGRLRGLAVAVRNHEVAHVNFLVRALGRAAGPAPRFNFKNTVTNRRLFVNTAIVLEDTGVAAYGGQVANIRTPAILNAAAQIYAVEARHAAAFRYYAGRSPAPVAFNALRSRAQVLAAVGRTGFVVT